MNLIVDIGNTLMKLAVFDAGEIQLNTSCEKEDFEKKLLEISKIHPSIDQCIISSVGTLEDSYLNYLNDNYNTMVLNAETSVPFINKYSSPATLGTDRIALISGAALSYPNRNVLVIDAGTCITYDFINSENEYLGGGISPGLQMRYKALNSFTTNLPELNPKMPENIVGNDTSTSIHGGVIYGILCEIDGFINIYKSNYDDLTIILTGGDADFLRDSLKNDIFANSNFLLKGLNYILEHNKY